MKDRLPRISVRIDTTPVEFLRRIETLARQIGEYIVETERDMVDASQVTALKLKPILVSQHRELVGWIIPAPGKADRVALEVHAARWNPEPPTYKVYVATARDIFKPLLHQYNRKYRTNRKLQIQSQAATEPSLPLVALQVFNRFADRANKSALSNRDWQRFYHFIWHCTAHNVHIARDDVHRLLVHAGFSVEHAADLADIFEHGRALLVHRRGDERKRA
ncbi:MAG: hypothetical protein ACETWG_09675 [Candidatus Neomarinimicrobiota bacterium]